MGIGRQLPVKFYLAAAVLTAAAGCGGGSYTARVASAELAESDDPAYDEYFKAIFDAQTEAEAVYTETRALLGPLKSALGLEKGATDKETLTSLKTFLNHLKKNRILLSAAVVKDTLVVRFRGSRNLTAEETTTRDALQSVLLEDYALLARCDQLRTDTAALQTRLEELREFVRKDFSEDAPERKEFSKIPSALKAIEERRETVDARLVEIKTLLASTIQEDPLPERLASASSAPKRKARGGKAKGSSKRSRPAADSDAESQDDFRR